MRWCLPWVLALEIATALCALAACSTGSEAEWETVDSGVADVWTAPFDAAQPVGEGASPADPSPALPRPPPHPYARGIAIHDVAMYQAVRIPLVVDGAAVVSRNAPIIAGRKGLIRVALTREPDYLPHTIQGLLRLVGPTGEDIAMLTATLQPTADSMEEELSSTLNFEIGSDLLVPGMEWSIVIHETSGLAPSEGVAPDGKAYPLDLRSEELGVAASHPLKLVIVPLAWAVDGSNRLPDLSEDALGSVRDRVMKLFPVRDVELRVRDAVPYANAKVSPNGDGWSEVLAAVIQQRQADQVAKDEFYVGLFRPDETSLGYCPIECLVALVAGVANATDDTSVHRTLIAVDYPDLEPPQSVAHELGHLHGRLHSPGPPECDVAPSQDPLYPYPLGRIGVPGYDILNGSWLSPTEQTDFMGYCLDPWVSDYTYRRLYARTLEIRPMVVRGVEGAGTTYRMAADDGRGAIHWVSGILRERLPRGEPRILRTLDAEGKAIRKFVGSYISFDHLPGGFLFVPVSGESFDRIEVVGPRGDIVGELFAP